MISYKQITKHLQLKIFELGEQVFGCSLNMLFKQLLFLSFKFGCQQLDVPLNEGNKLFLVKSRLLLQYII